MSFTAEWIGGDYYHKLNQNEIPNYFIGDLVVAVPFDHTKWNNAGIIGTECGQASSNKVGLRATNDMERTNGMQYGWSFYTNGGGKPHNNIQPYVVTYFWRRIK